MTIRHKVAHVKAAAQTRDHDCHWTGCKTKCPPAMWGCSKHWFMLPREIRTKIWAAYRIGQEEGLATVTDSYIEAAREAERYIRQNGLEAK